MAVVAVVIFHFAPNILPGGFVGVDVFFVISGYLMTSIIFSRLEKNTFSIKNFYIARCNRIIPALAVLCATLLLLGWFFLTPSDYSQLGIHAASSISFISNFLYWSEIGYFNETAREKWLLHTWSLSVEWQFYLLYPVFLTIMAKLFSLKTIRPVIISLVVLGFLFCIVITIKRPDAAFYLLPARAWEMLLGGVAFLYPLRLTPRINKLSEYTGIALILLSYFLFTEDLLWPGYFSFVPVFGTFLVILGQNKKGFILNNHASQWIGKISYSVYLWHWPLVISLNYASKSTDMTYMIIAILLSFLLGHLSFNYVEKNKTLFNQKNTAKNPYSLPILFVFTVLIMGFTVNVNEGIKSRTNNQYNAFIAEQIMPTIGNGYCFYSIDENPGLDVSNKALSCTLGNSEKKPHGLLFGDSFAGHYEPMWDKIATENNISLSSITTNWCFPSFTNSFIFTTDHPAFEQCKINRNYIQENILNYDFIILSGSWISVFSRGFENDVFDVVQFAREKGLTVYIMAAPTHYDTNVLKRFQMAYFNGLDFELQQIPKTTDTPTKATNLILKNYADRYGDVFYIDRASLFDPSGTYIKNEIQVPYSLDGFHISLEGSKAVANFFKQSDLYKQTIQKQLLTHN
ncbi:MAG: acyltransferase [Emcibacteraceae bacterium]|nr:acyltransferase [Emcibacteraceae bacterium]